MEIYELPDRIQNNHLKEAQCATREHRQTVSWWKSNWGLKR